MFKLKAIRMSGKSVGELEGERNLRAATIDALTESAQAGDIEDAREDGKVSGKVKKQYSAKLQAGKIKIKEQRLRELLHDTEAQEAYRDEPLFRFMRLCIDEDVACLPVLQRLALKRFILIN